MADFLVEWRVTNWALCGVSSTVEAVSDASPHVPLDADTVSGHDETWRRLFTELAGGRMAALDDLYDLAAGKIYGLALWRTSSTEDAADVVQEVFVKLAEQGARLSGVRNPRTWLLTVARRAAIDVVRRRRRLGEEPIGEHPFLADADAGEHMLDAARVSQLLARLLPKHREVVFLKYYGGCTFKEIGVVTGVPTFTAASRYRAAVAQIKRLSEVRW